MSKLPVISGAECVKALEQIGFFVDRQRGSHIILVREYPRVTVSVPDHKELDRGTLRVHQSRNPTGGTDYSSRTNGDRLGGVGKLG